MLANVVIICVLFIDQITKILVLKNLKPNVSLPLINNVFNLTYVKNTGTAFGLFLNQTTLFIIISIITSIAIILYLKFPSLFKIKTKLQVSIELALCLILGGAMGNLIDRIRFGYVIDFLDFRIWPVFNVADSAITAGAAVLAWRILFSKGGKT